MVVVALEVGRGGAVRGVVSVVYLREGVGDGRSGGSLLRP